MSSAWRNVILAVEGAGWTGHHRGMLTTAIVMTRMIVTPIPMTIA